MVKDIGSSSQSDLYFLLKFLKMRRCPLPFRKYLRGSNWRLLSLAYYYNEGAIVNPLTSPTICNSIIGVGEFIPTTETILCFFSNKHFERASAIFKNDKPSSGNSSYPIARIAPTRAFST